MTKGAQPIIITGFMCAGKTTVAAALARRLECAMIDLDQFVKERTGHTPQAIIDEDGEQRFLEKNRALIVEQTILTIWLDAPFDLCWQRIETEIHARPLARERAKARALYDERRAIYSQARLRVKVDGNNSADAIAEVIVTALAQQTEGKR
jgi:shikimate kinase